MCSLRFPFKKSDTALICLRGSGLGGEVEEEFKRLERVSLVGTLTHYALTLLLVIQVFSKGNTDG